MSPQTSPQMSRRGFVRMAGAAALGASGLGSLAGCGGSGGKGGGEELSFVYMGTATQQKAWDQLFAAFRSKNPDISLKVTGIPVDDWAAFHDKFSTQLAGGVKYDVVNLATEGMRLFADKGLLHPIDDFIAQDRAVVDEYLGDVHPSLAKWSKEYGSTGDGKTYFLPGDFNTMCLWFNKDVFKKAGADLPTPEWTWDDFMAAGRRIKERTGAYLYPVTNEYFISVMPWLTSNGASTMSPDWKTATANSPQAVEAAEFVRQLVVDKLAAPPGGSIDRFTLAVQGRLAAFGGGRWPIIDIRAQRAVDKFGIVPWPHKGAPNGSPVGWGGYPILRRSQNKEAAWTFVKYLISKEAVALWAKLGGTIVPGRRSVASGEEFLADAPTGTEYLYKALDYATPIPSPAKSSLIQRSIQDTWGQIMTGGVTPAAGMAKMNDQITQNL